MRKYITYILILVALVGLFSPVFKIQAQTTQELGTCFSNGVQYNNWDKTSCLTNSSNAVWSANNAPTGKCTYSKNGQYITADGWKQVECAQSNGSWTGPYVLLAPLPCANGTPGCVSGQLTVYDPTTGTNQIGTYLNVMIRIFIGLCAVLSVIMIVIGGIEYMTSELPGNKEHGRERITGAIFGLVLALGAWTLLYQINPDILNTDLNSLTNVSVSVTETSAQNEVPQPLVNGKYGNYPAGANWQGIAGAPATLPAGVSLNAAQCTTVGQTGCTSTDGLNTSLINSIASGCASGNNGTPCPIKLTAGTESWLHGGDTGKTSHGPGSPTVDLSETPALNSYLNGSTGSGSSFPSGSVITDKANNACYYAEPAGSTSSTTGNHWHVYALPSNGQC
jgi:hypothetical protein